MVRKVLMAVVVVALAALPSVGGTAGASSAPATSEVDWWGRIDVTTQTEGSGPLGDCPGDANFYDCLDWRHRSSLTVRSDGSSSWRSVVFEDERSGYPGLCEIATTGSRHGSGASSDSSIGVTFGEDGTYQIDQQFDPGARVHGESTRTVTGVPECHEIAGGGGTGPSSGPPKPVFPNLEPRPSADPDDDHLSGDQTWTMDLGGNRQITAHATWSLYRGPVDCNGGGPLPDACVAPELEVATTSNGTGSALRPTTHRRVEPGVEENDPSVDYARFTASIGVPASASPQPGPFVIDLALGQGLVLVGPDEPSQQAGWECELPEPGSVTGAPARCTIRPEAPVPGGASPPELVLLADVGWEALPDTSVEAFAWFGASEVAETGPIAVPAAATIVGLGDSFSSGEGVYHYPPPADRNARKGGCHRSPRSWQHVWATGVLEGTTDPEVPLGYIPGFVHAACSGALTDALQNSYAGPGDGILDPPEPPQISALRDANDEPRAVDAVVATFGGNDALFGDIVARCLLPGSFIDDCDDEEVFAHDATADKVTRRVNWLYPTFVETFRAIRAATAPSGAADDPDSAAVFVSGYPMIVPAVTENFCWETGWGALSADERAWFREKVTVMDEVLSSAARAAGVHYISVVPIFEQNWYCQPGDAPSAMLGVSPPESLNAYGIQEAFHPTPVGFDLWGRAALAQHRVPTANPAPETVVAPGPTDNPLLPEDLRVDEEDAAGTPPSTNAEQILASSAPVTIPVDSWLPGGEVEVVVASDPIELGSFPVDAQGVATVTVPAEVGGQLDEGMHHLVVTGTGASGGRSVWMLSLPVAGEIAPQGSISGTVRDDPWAEPVGDAFLALLSTSDFSLAGAAVADDAGEYVLDAPPGDYYLYVIDPTGARVAGFHGAPATITVTAGESTEVNPAVASLRGAVTATVTGATSGEPVPGVWGLSLSASAANAGATELAVDADEDGRLTLGGLLPGNHFIGFVDPAGEHTARFWPDSPNVPDSTPVTAVVGETVTADAELPAQVPVGTGAVLSGSVTDEETGDPIEGARVVALREADYQMVRGAVTDGSGQYSLDLAPGSYKLAFLDGAGRHDMEWFDDQPPTALGDAVSVVAPGTADAALAPNTGSFSGTVTDSSTGSPLGGAWVVAIGPQGITGGTVTAADGTYRIAGLAPGTYRATFVDPVGGRPQEYWQDSVDYVGATPFAVSAGASVTIDAALG